MGRGGRWGDGEMGEGERQVGQEDKENLFKIDHASPLSPTPPLLHAPCPSKGFYLDLYFWKLPIGSIEGDIYQPRSNT